jgi:hypothetical protein
VQHLREVSNFQTNFGRPKYSGPDPMSFPKTVTAYGRRTLFSVEPGLVGQPQNTMKSHYSSQLQHSLTSHCVPHVTVLTYGNHDAWSMTLMRDRDPSTVYRELRCAGLYREIKRPRQNGAHNIGTCRRRPGRLASKQAQPQSQCANCTSARAAPTVDASAVVVAVVVVELDVEARTGSRRSMKDDR